MSVDVLSERGVVEDRSDRMLRRYRRDSQIQVEWVEDRDAEVCKWLRKEGCIGQCAFLLGLGGRTYWRTFPSSLCAPSSCCAPKSQSGFKAQGVMYLLFIPL